MLQPSLLLVCVPCVSVEFQIKASTQVFRLTGSSVAGRASQNWTGCRPPSDRWMSTAWLGGAGTWQEELALMRVLVVAAIRKTPRLVQVSRIHNLAVA